MDGNLVDELLKLGNWGEDAVTLGRRAGFSCEYCGKDLLASVENFKEWQNDHIVPASAGGDHSDENIAVSCRTCNWSIKGRWNPLTVCGDQASRRELIDAARTYIRQKRTEKMKELVRIREIIERHS